MSKTEIQIQKWIKHGSMLVNAECLELSHPMHPYNQALAQGVDPEDFGIEGPADEFKDWSRGKLIKEIIGLRKEILGLESAGFL